jgi:hypothetical protein
MIMIRTLEPRYHREYEDKNESVRGKRKRTKYCDSNPQVMLT